jgi:class 3 adenylate cyclase
MGQAQGERRSHRRLGIWIDGSWYAPEGAFNQAESNALKQALAVRFAGSPEPSGDLQVDLNGDPTRVMYQALIEPMASHGGGGVPYQVGAYSLAESIRQQAALRRQVLGVGGLAMTLALGLSLGLAQGLSVPIRALVAGANEVRRGNYAVKVPVRSRDELGDLTHAFNEMTAGLELKERYRTILNSVADESVARRLIEGGLVLGGEVRPVSVLFCDIRGFTAHTENMLPSDIVEMLNEHMTALTRIVKEHGGVLDKFVGDLLMALFGAPMSGGKDTLNAARCALGIVREREQLNTVSRHRLQVGIGLATGEVVAGCMGSLDRLNYTVIGKRVNLASRLCSLAKAGQVVIDEATRGALGDIADARPLPPVHLKGFTEPVQGFDLVGLHEPMASAAPTLTGA